MICSAVENTAFWQPCLYCLYTCWKAAWVTSRVLMSPSPVNLICSVGSSVEPRLCLPCFDSAPSCRLFNLSAAVHCNSVAPLFHACPFIYSTRTHTLSPVSHFTPLCFLVNTATLICTLRYSSTSPSPNKHNTQMLISIAREQKSFTLAVHEWSATVCNPLTSGCLSRNTRGKMFETGGLSYLWSSKVMVLIYWSYHLSLLDCWITAESAEENSIWVTLKNVNWAEWQGQVWKSVHIPIFSIDEISLRLEKMIKIMQFS